MAITVKRVANGTVESAARLGVKIQLHTSGMSHLHFIPNHL